MLFMNLSQTLHAISIICNFISSEHFFKVYLRKAKFTSSRVSSFAFNSGLVRGSTEEQKGESNMRNYKIYSLKR